MSKIAEFFQNYKNSHSHMGFNEFFEIQGKDQECLGQSMSNSALASLIEMTDGKQVFKDEVFTFQQKSIKGKIIILMDEEGKEVTATMMDEAYVVVDADQQEHILNLVDPENKYYNYTTSGKAVFINKLYQQYKQTEHYPLQDAIDAKDVDHLVQYHLDKVLDMPADQLMRLNYY